MATKVKADSKSVLKGQEAEDKVLEYVKLMNRPYGAVDVAANLKGAVPKAATQKILIALAEKGELVQKTYGKTTFFVANQERIESMPAEKIATVEAEIKMIDEENKMLAAEAKAMASELSKLKITPTDMELDIQIAQVEAAMAEKIMHLEPLRSGAPPISAEELAQVNAEWNKWRAEWVRRRKVFNTFWRLATDALPPQESTALSEELGIEMDTPEHRILECGPVCEQKSSSSLKRKRV